MHIKKRILVTGGAGYIGSHTCKALANAGYTPVTYDNLINGHEWAVKWGPLERGDILDRKRLDEVFLAYRPEAVIHFAAYAYVGESVEEPAKYYNNNLVGTLSLLETMRVHGVDTLVFSSSCAVYGIPQILPIMEEHPYQPISPYGRSKYMIEQVLEDFDKAYDLLSISLRYFNAAGADPETEIGEVHKPETHLIPIIMDVALGRRANVEIYGTDYETPDGTCIRDYVHVTDLAQAHLLALEKLLNGAPSGVYNLGSERGASVKEVLEVVQNVTDSVLVAKAGARRPGDPPMLCADSTRAKNELGWYPRFSDVLNIVETAWNWHKLQEK